MVILVNTGDFTGSISVGGTLTYEDVTNVDFVGLFKTLRSSFWPSVSEALVVFITGIVMTSF